MNSQHVQQSFVEQILTTLDVTVKQQDVVVSAMLLKALESAMVSNVCKNACLPQDTLFNKVQSHYVQLTNLRKASWIEFIQSSEIN